MSIMNLLLIYFIKLKNTTFYFITNQRYGKSMMLANPEQRITFNNVSQECFGNINACKNGYTLKLWFCLTNYNNQVVKNSNR